MKYSAYIKYVVILMSYFSVSNVYAYTFIVNLNMPLTALGDKSVTRYTCSVTIQLNSNPRDVYLYSKNGNAFTCSVPNNTAVNGAKLEPLLPKATYHFQNQYHSSHYYTDERDCQTIAQLYIANIRENNTSNIYSDIDFISSSSPTPTCQLKTQAVFPFVEFVGYAAGPSPSSPYVCGVDTLINASNNYVNTVSCAIRAGLPEEAKKYAGTLVCEIKDFFSIMPPTPTWSTSLSHIKVPTVPTQIINNSVVSLILQNLDSNNIPVWSSGGNYGCGGVSGGFDFGVVTCQWTVAPGPGTSSFFASFSASKPPGLLGVDCT